MPASSLALVVAAASSSSPLHARHDSVRGDEDDSSALPKSPSVGLGHLLPTLQ